MTAVVAPIEVHALAKAMPYTFVCNDDGRGNCIWATKLAVEVLRKEGIACKPMACNIYAFNAVALALFDQGVPMAEWPKQAWSVGVACENQVASDSKMEPGRKTGFGGHLVVVGETWFLDLTIEQLDRPAKGIVLPGPIVGPFEPGRMDESIRLPLDSGGAVQWAWRPQFKSWRTVNAWRADMDPGHVSGARGRLWRERERLLSIRNP